MKRCSIHLEWCAIFISTLSIYPSACSLFLFIPNTPLHQVMFCFQATDRLSRFPLLLQSQLSHPALWPLHLLGFTVGALSFPSPVEVPALPRCQMRKEFWCNSGRRALWHIQMAGNGWRVAKQKGKKHSQKKGMNTECASDLQEINTGPIMLINQ